MTKSTTPLDRPPGPDPSPKAAGVARGGIAFGCGLALVTSYAANASILWACVHGICGWFYIFYALIVGDASCGSGGGK